MEVILKFEEKFQIWISEVTRTTSPDRKFEWNSLMSLLDKDCTKRMKEDKALKHKSLDEIFKKMNIILLDRFPLLGRRIDHEKNRKSNN